MPESKGALKIYKSARQIFFHNFLGGIGWGVGSVIGATIIVGILGILLNWFGGMPIIGRWIGEVTQSIREGINSVPH